MIIKELNIGYLFFDVFFAIDALSLVSHNHIVVRTRPPYPRENRGERPGQAPVSMGTNG